MDKIDFSNLYKFICSIASAAIIGGFLYPNIWAKDIQNVIITTKKEQELTANSRDLLNNRQKQLLFFHTSIPYVSGTLIIAGFMTLIFGLRQWQEQQNIEDETKELELETIRKNIEYSVIENKNIEDSKIEGKSRAELSIRATLSEKSKFKKGYSKAQKKVFAWLKKAESKGYKVYNNSRLTAEIIIDAVIFSLSKENSDIIVQFDYTNKPNDWRFIRESMLRCISNSKLYSQIHARKSMAMLIVASEKIDEETRSSIITLANEEAKNFPEPFKFEFISLKDFTTEYELNI